MAMNRSIYNVPRKIGTRELAKTPNLTRLCVPITQENLKLDDAFDVDRLALSQF